MGPVTYQVGTRRGLDECSSPDGIFAILAIDHRQNLRRLLRPEDPASVTADEMIAFKQAVVRNLAAVSTGILFDPELGAAQCVLDGSLPGTVGFLVAVEATGYEGPETARSSRLLDHWGVRQVKRMGASAAKLLVYFHPDAPNADDQRRLVDDVAEACRDADLPLFVEPLSYSLVAGQPLVGEARTRVVVETARQLTVLGGDVLKAEFPYDSVLDEGRCREACEELNEASSVPWVLLSGGVTIDEFEQQARLATAAGASGVAAGRSVWGEAAAMDGLEREEFLQTVARPRLQRLGRLLHGTAQPWRRRLRATQLPPDETWYTKYRG